MRYGKCSSRQRPRDADEMVVVIKRRKHWLSRGPLDREAACITAVEKPGIFASKFASLERDQAPALGEHLLGMARFRRRSPQPDRATMISGCNAVALLRGDWQDRHEV